MHFICALYKSACFKIGYVHFNVENILRDNLRIHLETFPPSVFFECVDLYPQKTGLKVGRFCLYFIDKGLLNKNIKDNFVFKFC